MAEDDCGNVATILINVTRNPCQIGNLQYGDSKDMNEIKFRVYPNPFRDLARFEICLPYDSRVRIDIFTYNGTLVATILDEVLVKREVRIVEFDASRYPQTTFVYRITTGMTWYNGTLIRSR